MSVLPLEQVRDKINDIEYDYKLIGKVEPEFQQRYSLEEFSKMRMIVSSRIFGIKINGKKTDCLCPLADMLNHYRPRQTQWFYSDELDSFVIQSINEINPNEEIFDSYGKKCNSRFFLNYGFIVENNDSNEVQIQIELDKKSANYDFKIHFLTVKETKRVYRIQESTEDPAVIEVMNFLRFIEYDEDIYHLIKVMPVN